VDQDDGSLEVELSAASGVLNATASIVTHCKQGQLHLALAMSDVHNGQLDFYWDGLKVDLKISDAHDSGAYLAGEDKVGVMGAGNRLYVFTDKRVKLMGDKSFGDVSGTHRLEIVFTPKWPRTKAPDSCAKDRECFRGAMTCDECCTTGSYLIGGVRNDCFNSEFTAERCCVKPPNAVSPANPTPVAPKGRRGRSRSKRNRSSGRSTAKETLLQTKVVVSGISSKTCLDPSLSDPESWECSCHETMMTECQGDFKGRGSMAQCYKHLLCTHEKVCQSWKDARCSSELLQAIKPKIATDTDALLSLLEVGGQSEERVGWNCG
jgi:hypothetical protein